MTTKIIDIDNSTDFDDFDDKKQNTKHNAIEIRFKEKPVSEQKINHAWERLKNQVKSAKKTPT